MSTLKLDILHTSDKNLGGKIGEFCGSPIREMYTDEMEIDRIVETARTIEINRGTTPLSVLEILPGEMICEDGIVRRGTTAEALGEIFYDYQPPKDTRVVTVEEGRALAAAGALVTFRPDRVVGQNEFAIVHEGVN